MAALVVRYRNKKYKLRPDSTVDDFCAAVGATVWSEVAFYFGSKKDNHTGCCTGSRCDSRDDDNPRHTATLFYTGLKPAPLARFHGASAVVRDYGARILDALEKPEIKRPALLFLPAKSLLLTGVAERAFFSHGFPFGPSAERRRGATARRDTLWTIQRRCAELWGYGSEALAETARRTAAALEAGIHRHATHTKPKLFDLVCTMIACAMCAPGTGHLRVGNELECNVRRYFPVNPRCVPCTLASTMPNSGDVERRRYCG